MRSIRRLEDPIARHKLMAAPLQNRLFILERPKKAGLRGWLLAGACCAQMTGGSVAESSYACIGFLPKQIVSGGFEQAKFRHLLPRCYPAGFWRFGLSR